MNKTDETSLVKSDRRHVRPSDIDRVGLIDLDGILTDFEIFIVLMRISWEGCGVADLDCIDVG